MSFTASTGELRDEWVAAINSAASGNGGGGAVGSTNASPAPTKKKVGESSSTPTLPRQPSASAGASPTLQAKKHDRLSFNSPSLSRIPGASGAAAMARPMNTGASAAEHAGLVSPREVSSEASKEFELVLRYSDSLDAQPEAGVLLSLAKELLESGCVLAATVYARAALDMAQDVRDEAVSVMHKAEATVFPELGKGGGWDSFEREMMQYGNFFATQREALAEALSEKDEDLRKTCQQFATSCVNQVVVPLVTNMVRQLPKAPTKFAVLLFDLMSVEERMPYDPLNPGIVVQDMGPGVHDYFVRFLKLLELRLAQLGENGAILFSQKWETRFPGFRFSSRDTFLEWTLVGTVEQYLELLDVQYEDDYIYQSMCLLTPGFVFGEKALHKRYLKEVNTLIDSVLVLPLGHTGPYTYKEHAHAKLPPKKKLDVSEAPVSIRKTKATKFLGWISDGWADSLFLVKDNVFPRLVSYRTEFWLPLYGVLAALRLQLAVPQEMSTEDALNQLMNTHQILGKRSARHLQAALERVTKYRMLAQLNNRSCNESIYHRDVVKPPGAWEITGKYLEKAIGLYQVVLPLIIGADDYFHSGVLSKNTFNLENLQLDTPWVRLLALQRMGIVEEALKAAVALTEGQSFSYQRLISASENVANTRAQMGDFNGAAADLGILKEICVDQRSKKHVAAVNGKLSVVMDLAGHEEKAHEYRAHALEYMTATGACKRDRICLNINEACNLMMRGKYAEAKLLLEASIKSSAKGHDSRVKRLDKRALKNALPALLHNLGTCLLLMGSTEAAIEKYSMELRMVTTRDGVQSLNAGFCYLNLAAAHASTGNADAAKCFALYGSQIFLRMLGRADPHVVGTVEFLKSLK